VTKDIDIIFKDDLQYAIIGFFDFDYGANLNATSCVTSYAFTFENL